MLYLCCNTTDEWPLFCTLPCIRPFMLLPLNPSDSVHFGYCVLVSTDQLRENSGTFRATVAQADLQRIVCIVQAAHNLPATFTAAANDQHLLDSAVRPPCPFLCCCSRLIVFLHLKLIFHLLSSTSSGNSSSSIT